jgi:hypothetical protein
MSALASGIEAQEIRKKACRTWASYTASVAVRQQIIAGVKYPLLMAVFKKEESSQREARIARRDD